MATSTYGNVTSSAVFDVNDLSSNTGGEKQKLTEWLKQAKFEIRCCCPATIVSVDYDKMTCSVQPVIKEKIVFGTTEIQEFELPIIQDVPLVYLSNASGISITYPVNVDDECLLFFSDTCIDAWWQSGGIQSAFENRRHDLSDCFCLPCQMSQAKKLQNISQTNLQLRNNTSELLLNESTAKIRGENVEVTSQNEKYKISVSDNAVDITAQDVDLYGTRTLSVVAATVMIGTGDDAKTIPIINVSSNVPVYLNGTELGV